ncbi:MAG TPA: ATP-binding protein [Ktedonosporobacter sp.]|nr:ATP-binding protein [Ktedonosporobacter sp.]
MYIPLSVRLTLFYTIILALALWFFGPMVYTQAEKSAYNDLRDTLATRARGVQWAKAVLSANSASQPITLPGVNEFGEGGVGIEVLAVDDTGNPTSVLATNAGTPDSADPTQPTIINLGTHPPQGWNPQAIQQVIQQNTPDNPVGIYKEITYQGERMLVYTIEGPHIYTGGNSSTRTVIQTAHSERDIQQTLNDLRMTILGGAILVIVFALLGGWFISRGVLSAVQRMTHTAQSISASRAFSQRVPDKAVLGRDELATLAATFNQMLASLEEAYQRQQRFIADASHELRAPITSIRCNLDLLAKAPDLPAEEVESALADTRTEAERMGRLVNDLLTLAHSDEAQQLSLSNDYTNSKHSGQQVDLDSLLLAVFRQYRPLEEQGDDGQRLHGPRLLLQHITPAHVIGNEDQLKQALVALVDNALKYTPQEGCVSLSLNVDEGFALVKVSDTGIGIDPEGLPHIFERFYRANRVRTRDRGGSGLGLAIAESIIKEHQGNIEVESTLGKGSTFTVKLPVHATS